MSIGTSSGARRAPALAGYGRARPRSPARQTSATSNGFAAWLLAIAIAMPASMTIFLGETKFTPARIIILALLVPALALMFKKGRRLFASDFFAGATAVWMIGVTLQTDPQSWSSAVAVAVEFSAAYIVARGYIFGPDALHSFIRALKLAAAVVIGLAALEHLAQQHITHNTIAAFWGLPRADTPEFRYGIMRASSTFPHSILYGTFCAITGAIFLYSERGSGRIFWVGLCAVGCFLAMSSAPIMSFMIAISIFFYDAFLRRYHWRWQVMTAAIAMMLVVIYLGTNKPISWIISHLTLDPATGYFRVATWEVAFHYIGLSPLVGYGFEAFADKDDFFGNASVDTVWLTLALRFGLPFIVLVFIMNILAFVRSGSTSGPRRGDPYMDDMCTGFTLAVVLFMFTGLTVHYWNNIWMFWGIVIGIRASLKEEYSTAIRMKLRSARAARAAAFEPSALGASSHPAMRN